MTGGRGGGGGVTNSDRQNVLSRQYIDVAWPPQSACWCRMDIGFTLKISDSHTHSDLLT